ncbi:MAG: HAD family hydrolase [Chloroflexota bacterium]|nr:HAD family hydrolase [Chloroflexota bacterium]
MSPFRAAFFDFGGTLVEAAPGEDHWRPVVMARVRREFGDLPLADALYAADIRRAPPDDPHRQETNRWIAEWLRARGETWTDPDVERLRVAFASPLPDAFSLAPGAEAALRWSKAHGLTVAVLTNTITRGDMDVLRDCQRLRLDGLVDHVVSSYSIGWSKPHPAMFERALELAGAAPKEAFMVGDEFVADVVGAKRIGMRAVWKSERAIPEGQYQERPDATIASLVELPGILRSWMGG